MKNKKIKVLHVINGMGSGGAEMLIMNWLRTLNNELIQFDFLLRSRDCIYEEEIKSYGGRIFYTASFPKHFFRNYIETKKFFKNHKEYDVVHIHANSLLYMYAFIFSKKIKIPLRITHSHSTKTQKNFYRILHLFNKNRLKFFSNKFIACSDKAGKWMFGNKPYQVIENGIAIDKFSYNPEKRVLLRTEMHIPEDYLVIGHVGRFLKVKNQDFLVKLFSKYHKKNPKSLLLLVGIGPEENNLKILVKQLNIENNVKFLGHRTDISDLQQIFDIFIFPSLHEGLPLSLLEAQAAGLPCLISNRISSDSILSKNLVVQSLDDSFDQWISSIEYLRKKFSREENYLIEGFNNYSVTNSAKKIMDIYLES